MARAVSRRLVIDTSIARASGGGNAVFPASKTCRDFLKSVLVVCHRIVFTPEIADEWKRHRSRFARTWLTSMFARKKVYRVPSSLLPKLRARIQDSVVSDAGKREVEKDHFLLEAALATDSTIVSLDDSVRRLLSGASEHVDEIRRLVWVNPINDEESVFMWLEGGANPDMSKQLGNRKAPRRR